MILRVKMTMTRERRINIELKLGDFLSLLRARVPQNIDISLLSMKSQFCSSLPFSGGQYVSNLALLPETDIRRRTIRFPRIPQIHMETCNYFRRYRIRVQTLH